MSVFPVIMLVTIQIIWATVFVKALHSAEKAKLNHIAHDTRVFY